MKIYRKYFIFSQAFCYVAQIIDEGDALDTSEDVILSYGGYFYHYMDICVETPVYYVWKPFHHLAGAKLIDGLLAYLKLRENYVSWVV
jgi:hypothetical protein